MQRFWTRILPLLAAGKALLPLYTAQQQAPTAFEVRPPERSVVWWAKELPPPELPPVELEASHNNPQVEFPARRVMRTRKEFRRALGDLRRRYAPFLEDHTPPWPSSRARVTLDTFQFRMEEPGDQKDITQVFRGEGNWQTVRIPDYRGPVGWWAGYYRKVLQVPDSIWRAEAVFLRFGGVDYRCQVYLNGRMVRAHEGFFAPFDIDITPYLRRDAENVLVVRIENESIMMGSDGWNGPKEDGDKLYAAVGPGWDDPKIGWHECPPGAGIWQSVYLEGRSRLSITDVFVRPKLHEKAIEARIEVYQPEKTYREVDLAVSVYPKNFAGPPLLENIPVALESMGAGPGLGEYRVQVRLGDFRNWAPETPYLYTLRIAIRPRAGGAADVQDAPFGMREFAMDETAEVKGTLSLNGEPIILRGANTMGNFQVPVMRGSQEQLIEDILIAKLANMNFFRLTQSPVQPEVYDMCDRLGMMLQTDLPLFGYLRRPQLEEAIRQAGEMERLVRNHPSNILITWINEPTRPPRRKANRHLLRAELESFFEAATSVVRVYNPDRVIKAADGDFEPPGPGLPDVHEYPGWYGEIGRRIRGYRIAVKDGWKSSMGEYGVEGLEDADTMFRHYPKEWLPRSEDDPWTPALIPFAQSWATHFQWYDTQDTMRQWIDASQRHQAWVVGTITRALRRHSDAVISTALHLLIDAWPSSWMKAVVDVDRHPKPAYFAFKEALTPLMVDIRTDRTRFYSGEPLPLEFWLCNDRRAQFARGELVWEVQRAGERVFAQSAAVEIPSFNAAFQGWFHYKAPVVDQRERLTVRLGLKSPIGELVHDTELDIEVFPAVDTRRNTAVRAGIVGSQGGRAWRLAEALGVRPCLFPCDASVVFVDSPDAFEMLRPDVLRLAHDGGTAIFLEQPAGAVWRIDDRQVTIQKMPAKEFVSRKTGHPLVTGFHPGDFAFWYDRTRDHISPVAFTYLEGAALKPVVVSGCDDPVPERRTRVVVAERTTGKGFLIMSQLEATERVEYEPVAAAFYQRIVDRAVSGKGQHGHPHAPSAAMPGRTRDRLRLSDHGAILDTSKIALAPREGVPGQAGDRVLGLASLADTAFLPRRQPQTASTDAAYLRLSEAVAWLEKEAHRIIRTSVRKMKDGTSAFPPQVGVGYEAFWLRDYEYTLEGSADSYSNEELIAACNVFIKGLRKDGAGVDCVKFDGTSIYKPGFGSMGDNPVADGSQFTVGVAWHTYRKTQDGKYIASIADSLLKTMNTVPRNPQTKLVHIKPGGWDRCPYGFTDTIRKQGDELFCSLLFVQASRQLSDLLAVVGRNDAASKWKHEADTVAGNIRTVFWNEKNGLFDAATIKCRQPDIWGSAFAVYLGVATKTQATSIATYFKDHYKGIVQNGQIRQLPEGMFWEDAGNKPSYQNGGFWATPAGWFIYTLDLVDPKLADQTVFEMVSDFQQFGACEWILGQYHGCRTTSRAPPCPWTVFAP